MSLVLNPDIKMHFYSEHAHDMVIVRWEYICANVRKWYFGKKVMSACSTDVGASVEAHVDLSVLHHLK